LTFSILELYPNKNSIPTEVLKKITGPVMNEKLLMLPSAPPELTAPI
jgi:hypothetical protein